jgi:hypothetical protein
VRLSIFFCHGGLSSRISQTVNRRSARRRTRGNTMNEIRATTSVFEQENSVRVLDRSAVAISSFHITLFKTKIIGMFKIRIYSSLRNLLKNS